MLETLSQEMIEITQFPFHNCCHISEENATFEIIFWSRKSSKKQKFGKRIDTTDKLEKFKFPLNLHCEKYDGISAFGLFCGLSSKKSLEN